MWFCHHFNLSHRLCKDEAGCGRRLPLWSWMHLRWRAWVSPSRAQDLLWLFLSQWVGGEGNTSSARCVSGKSTTSEVEAKPSPSPAPSSIRHHLKEKNLEKIPIQGMKLSLCLVGALGTVCRKSLKDHLRCWDLRGGINSQGQTPYCKSCKS